MTESDEQPADAGTFDRSPDAPVDPQHAAPEEAGVSMRITDPAFTDGFKYGEVTVTRDWSPVPASQAAEFVAAAEASGITLEQEG